ncbi:hypothetical protein ACPC54_37530 [Kitasatospora sp. NPDC094028]
MSGPETAAAQQKDLVRGFVVARLVRCLQQADRPPGEGAGWWRRRRYARARARLERATDRALGFEGAVDEACLRYLKTELAIDVMTDPTVGEAVMWRWANGICSAQTMVELRDFARTSTDRPGWGVTADEHRPAP